MNDDKYTLEETIENYYTAMNGGWDENDYQMLAWLEELQDLRAILKERAPNEEEGEAYEMTHDGESMADGPISLEAYVEFTDGLVGLPYEIEANFWANQLLRARQRIEKEDDDA